MRKSIIGAVSAFALLSGAAMAADAQETGAQKMGAQPTGWTSLNKMVGKSIVDAQGNELGEIEDIVMDRQGKVQAVVDLEDADKDVALDATKLRPGGKDNGNFTMEGASKQQLAGMSGFSYDEDKADRTQQAQAQQEQRTEQRQGEQRQEQRSSTASAEGTQDRGERSADRAAAASAGAAGGTAAAANSASANNASGNSASTGNARSEVASGRASLEQMIGQSVVDAQGNELATIEDVILDTQGGQARQVVLDLEDSDKDVAMELNKLKQHAQEKDQWTLQGVDKQQLQAMGQFEYDQNTVALKKTGK
ncbi:MAG TPA: PRC-barrel domain-containing protein [Azospirillaceae bacterium]|nr:PRC-barrel domain-containing protein [Azospirillaceae bacterium]